VHLENRSEKNFSIIMKEMRETEVAKLHKKLVGKHLEVPIKDICT
jgi:hypothetical protein